ncbi:alcohol dehydrogenase catalytic domain-containing protein [Mesorhizobium xinjiangense]|uniref:alcohol dehydrogenase catalytic domain-containing protein n=1 Tax=Mesorhizobium xinjiangense TaxID=2678685 RepID=UPI0012EDA752|nr:alcohol dehydrogenase catalytic domain-containing protein [Mesorhizobium xinjiangense]
MKALVFLGRESIEFRDVADPVAGPGEAIVGVEACGICGSDMHGYHGHDPRRVPPMIMGHEIAGVVQGGALAGRRVAVNPLLTCGRCPACLSGAQQLCEEQKNIGLPPNEGGFAELVKVPERNVVLLPDGLDFAAAALSEPVAVAYHAMLVGARLTRRPLSASLVVVLGGGAIGLAAALVALTQGAGRVMLAETNEARRRTAAAASGRIEAYDPAGSSGPVEGSADLVFDAVGARATREAAFAMAARGAAIVHLGLLPGAEGVDVRRLTLREISFAGSYCYSTSDFNETVGLIAAGRLGPLGWVEERSMAEGAAAFRDIDTGTAAAAKIILRN